MREVDLGQLPGGEVDRHRECETRAVPGRRLRAGGVEHPVSDLDDQLAVLGAGEEARGQQLVDRAVLGAVGKPAHERLAADRAAAAERQDRLVGEHQLLARKRV